MERNRDDVLSDLMDAYYTPIWAYVYAKTRNHHAADDLTQDVFVRAFTHLGSFRHEASWKTWLYAIAHNVCRDYARSAVVRLVIPKDKPWFDGQIATARSAEEEALDFLEDEFWHVLMSLSMKEREVVLLHLKEDLTFREIASIVKAREVTVRARYRRALARLRTMLDAGDENDEF